MEIILIRNFLIAIALGALIGLEREYARYLKKGHDFAGIRTFPLITLFGALAAYFGNLYSIWIFIACIVLVGALIILAYFALSHDCEEKHTGTTSEVAAFLAFFIGAISYYGEILLAVSLTIAITIILYARSFLHNLAERMKPNEMEDTLKFIIIAFVILPLLPNKEVFSLFNPYIVWLMVVFVSGISFVGYILMKWLGNKGILLTGTFGGLVSGIAVISSLAEKSKTDQKFSTTLALGVILAIGVMFIRVLIEVFVVNPELLTRLLIPLGLLSVISGLFFLFLFFRTKKESNGNIELSSPIKLKTALKFGAIFAVILALVKISSTYLDTSWVYLISFLSGLANLDAITLSLSQSARNGLMQETAIKGIMIAVITNLAVKGGIAYYLGSKEFRKIIVSFFAFLIIIGIGLLLVF